MLESNICNEEFMTIADEPKIAIDIVACAERAARQALFRLAKEPSQFTVAH
jgi:hypothetical protein